MKDIKSIIQELRQPFPGKFVDWKVQSINKDETSALVVAYVDARDISERLNKVCPDQWSTKFIPIMAGTEVLGVECTLTIRTDTVALSRSDVGIGDLDDKRMNAGLKTHYSDALKRAGVHFGINSCAYELPQIWLKEADLYKPADKIKGISRDGKANLAERYNKFVQNDAIVQRFGAIYDG